MLAGVNLATLHGSEADQDTGNRVGFVGGVYLAVPLTDVLSFRPELLYSQQGAKTSDAAEGEAFSATLKLDYLEIPALLVADLPVSGSVRPQLYAGPSFAFKLRCGASASGGGVSIDASCDELETQGGGKLKSFDVGALVGGALTFDLKNGGALSVGVRSLRRAISASAIPPAPASPARPASPAPSAARGRGATAAAA